MSIRSRPHARPHARFGAVPVGRLAALVAAPAFERHGPGHGQIAAAWTEIVGPELARVSRPSRLTWPRTATSNRDRRGQGGATLTIEVDGPRAVELQHAAPHVLEAVNTLFGYRAVSRLRLVQGSPSRLRRRPPRQPIAVAPGDEMPGFRSPALASAFARLRRAADTR